MQNLVYIGRVQNIYPIENADKIESLEVICGEGGKWRGIAQKGEYKIGDLCQVYLQDSIVPAIDKFSFMEKHKYRVKMIRLKGSPSEVLIMPYEYIGNLGEDITEKVNVQKYQKPTSISMEGDVLGWFPSYIPQTDEQNFQRVPEIVETMRNRLFYSTTKIDGTSGTVYFCKNHFGCCSRTIERKESDKNLVWQMSKKYNLREALETNNFHLAFQFEIAGPGIQKNPVGLKEIEIFLFNIYDIDNNCYWSAQNTFAFANLMKIPTVPVIDWNIMFKFDNDEELRKYAEGTYPNGKQREGVVVRPMEELRDRRGNRVSFKVINLLYKD